MTFEFPWGLWGCLTCLIPWFFFLKKRERKTTQVVLATLSILSTRIIRHKQNRRRKEIYLLIIRSLFLLFLALLIAHPKLILSENNPNVIRESVEKSAISETNDPQNISVLIIDGSDSGPQRFKLPLQITTLLSPADSLALALNPFQKSFERKNSSLTENAANEFSKNAAHKKSHSKKNISFNVEQITSYQFSELPLRQLQTFDVLILVDLSEPLEKECEKINKFLVSSQKPKGLMFFLGTRTIPEKWNSSFWTHFAPEIKMDEIQNRSSSKDNASLIISDHLLFQPFLASESGIDRLSVSHFFPLKNHFILNNRSNEQKESESILISETTRFRSKQILISDRSSGLPLLLEWTVRPERSKPNEKDSNNINLIDKEFKANDVQQQSQFQTNQSPFSRILCWTTCPDWSMSSLTVDPIFLPLIQESVSYLLTPSKTSTDIAKSTLKTQEVSLISVCFFILMLLLTFDLLLSFNDFSQTSLSQKL